MEHIAGGIIFFSPGDFHGRGDAVLCMSKVAEVVIADECSTGVVAGATGSDCFELTAVSFCLFRVCGGASGSLGG